MYHGEQHLFLEKNHKKFLIKNRKNIGPKNVNPRVKKRKFLRILVTCIRENKGLNFQIEPLKKIDSFLIKIWIIF